MREIRGPRLRGRRTRVNQGPPDSRIVFLQAVEALSSSCVPIQGKRSCHSALSACRGFYEFFGLPFSRAYHVLYGRCRHLDLLGLFLEVLFGAPYHFLLAVDHLFGGGDQPFRFRGQVPCRCLIRWCRTPSFSTIDRTSASRIHALSMPSSTLSISCWNHHL